jgi:hypothetical protein
MNRATSVIPFPLKPKSATTVALASGTAPAAQALQKERQRSTTVAIGYSQPADRVTTLKVTARIDSRAVKSASAHRNPFNAFPDANPTPWGFLLSSLMVAILLAAIVVAGCHLIGVLK